MRTFLIALLGVFTITTFAQGPSKEGPSALSNSFYRAEVLRLTGRQAGAVKAYQQILKKDPENEVALYQLARMAAAEQLWPQCLDLAARGAKAHPENEWMWRILGESQIQLGQLEEALRSQEKLIALKPGSPLYVEKAYRLATALGKHERALEWMEQLNVLIGVNPDMAQQKVEHLMELGRKKEAERWLLDCVSKNPEEPSYLGLTSQFYESNGKQQEAIEILDGAISRFPDNYGLLLERARLLRAIGKYAESVSDLARALEQPAMPLQDKANILLSLTYAAKEDASLQPTVESVWAKLEELYSDEPKFYLLQAEQFISDAQWQLSIESYQKALEGGLQDLAIYQQIIEISLEHGDLSDGLELLEELRDQYLFNSEVLLYVAYMYYEYQEWAAAVAVIQDVLPMLSAGEEYLQALELGATCAFSANNSEQGMRWYEQYLDVDSASHILNNYAWELALADMELEKALSMTELSNRKSPNNANSLDTWAWVLYKMGRYSEAREKIEVALQLLGNRSNKTLFTHAARIYEALGDLELAAQYREKATGKAD